MKTQKHEFAERLQAAMLKAGLKPEAAILERGFNLNYYGKGMTLQGVNKWLKGESVPPYDKIIALAKWLSIPPEELTFGLDINNQLKEKNQRWKEAAGFEDREVFEAFLNLPAPQRKIVREVILAFAKAASL